jgi:hypothetical protein
MDSAFLSVGLPAMPNLRLIVAATTALAPGPNDGRA